MTASVGGMATLERNGLEPLPRASITWAALAGLADAVQKYFDLIYDCDTSHFDEVLRSAAHVHGFRDGCPEPSTTWSAAHFWRPEWNEWQNAIAGN